MLSTGVFPNRLKYTEVKSLFNKGDRTEISNYRPISLLPPFLKSSKRLFTKYYNAT